MLLYIVAFLLDGCSCQVGLFRSIEEENDDNNVVQSGRVSVHRVTSRVLE